MSLAAALDDGLKRFGVCGASAAVWRNGVIETAWGGLADAQAGSPVSADTVFEAGSITKLFTALLTLQLIEEGAFTLDTPVARLLPGFALADAAAAGAITVRHCLSHSSGMDGDYFLDTGDDDALARLIHEMSIVRQIHPPGQGFSYCNLGFAVLGRIVEQHRHKPFRQCLSRFTHAPFHLSSLSAHARYASAPVACGHSPKPGGGFQPMTPRHLAWSNAPVGATPVIHAADLARFGGALVSADADLAKRRDAMLVPQAATPPLQDAFAFGLGFMLFGRDAPLACGHDGATIGNLAFLRIVPAARLVIALMTNGGDGSGLAAALIGAIAQAEAGVTLFPDLPPPSAPGVPLSRLAGLFHRRSANTRIDLGDGGLQLSVIQHDPWLKTAYGDRGPFMLTPRGGLSFSIQPPGTARPSAVTFVQNAHGEITALDSGLRRFLRG